MKKSIKYILCIIISGIIFTSIGVYAATIINSKDVSFDNTQSNMESKNVQDAIDELYEIASSKVTECNKGRIYLYKDGVFNPDYTYSVTKTNSTYSRMNLASNYFQLTADVSGYTSIVWNNINVENYTLYVNVSLTCSVVGSKYMRFVSKNGSELARISQSSYEGLLNFNNAAGVAAVAETSSSNATSLVVREVYIEY